MYRISAILITLFQFSTYAFAQYQLDTLAHRNVGPGMVHTHAVDDSGPWNINIFTADLTNPYLEVESIKANDRLLGHERTSEMAARRDFEGHLAVGAVNGDFYGGGGEPINIQVVRGEVLKRETSGRTAVGFTPAYEPMMDVVGFSGELFAGEEPLVIDGVNEGRGADQVILYNSYMGTSTGANEFGTEIAVDVIDPWVVNDTLRAVVRNAETGVGDMDIPEGGAVLSAHGTASTTLQSAVAVDDTIRILTRVQPAPGLVKEMIGGGPFLVVDGQIDVGPRGDGGDRHPRTAVGFSPDSTKLILVTVDGRQSISAGMTLYELAGLMQQAGAATAMNLDGGGSTTMVVRSDVANSPSGNGERLVSNALAVFSTAPVGDIDRIRLSDRLVRLFRGRTYQVDVEAIDDFYNPLPLDSTLLSFEADPEIGTIDESGLLQTGMTPDTGYVSVTYDSFQDSLRVIVKEVGRIVISPETVLTDTLRAIDFDVTTYDTDNVQQSVADSELTWSARNEAVGTVDDAGIFRGHAPGETYVVVGYGEIRDSARVTIEVYGGYSVLDTLESTTGWQASSENAELDDPGLVLVDTTSTLGSHAFALSYRYTPNEEQSWIYLDRNIPVDGLPDSIMVDVWSDKSGHRIFFEAVDSKGDVYTRNPPGRRPNLPTDGFATVAAPFDATDMLHPIRFVRLGAQLAPPTGEGEQSGTILFDHLRVSYPGHTETAIVSDELPTEEVVLHPNFPNPFGNRTTLAYDMSAPGHVTLEVFDLLGRVVRTVEDGPRGAGRREVEIDANGLPSGIYFVRLTAGNVSKSRSISVIH